MFADYKATRTAMPDDLARQLPYVRRLFEALRTPVVEVPGFEADDVLATLVEQALRRDDLEVVVVSGDKDLLQLVGPRVRVLSVLGRTGERVMYDEAKVRERWGVEPGADRRRAGAHGRLRSTTSPASRASARRPRSS